MSARFEVHKLDGYTDGKPSWLKIHVPNSATFSRDSCQEEISRWRAGGDTGTYRVRKSHKRS